MEQPERQRERGGKERERYIDPHGEAVRQRLQQQAARRAPIRTLFPACIYTEVYGIARLQLVPILAVLYTRNQDLWPEERLCVLGQRSFAVRGRERGYRVVRWGAIIGDLESGYIQRVGIFSGFYGRLGVHCWGLKCLFHSLYFIGCASGVILRIEFVDFYIYVT